MAATTAGLARELSTIINSPYPVSLAKLAEICTTSDALTVRACVRQHPPCAIAKLASSLYDALPVWQCCVIILRCLSQSLEFKNELLSRNPGLLDALLTKANTSQQNFDQYHGLCIQLLADPLPEGVPLPASVQSFFLRVFGQASHRPNVQNLKPIYYMLTGACRGFLAILPSDARQLFDEQLCHILRAKSEDLMLSLWCFGVAILAEHPELIDSAHRSHKHAKDTVANARPTVEWTTATGRKLFGSPNAGKRTTKLACLSVIWALSKKSGVSDDEAIQGIRIATHALQLIDQSISEDWANTDMNANTITKLWEKIQLCDTKPAIQCEALYFYALVCGQTKLFPSVVELYEAVLMNMNGLGSMDSQKSLSFSLPLFANRMQQASVQSLLCRLLKTNYSHTSVEEVQNATALASEVAATALHHEMFRSHIIAALSNPGIQGDVEAFSACCTHAIEEDRSSFCPSHNNMIQRRCVSATMSMLLTIILAAGPEQSQRTLSPLGIALVEKQGQLSMPATQCTHIPGSRTPFPSVSLFEQQCTPISGLPLQDWRGRLKNELENQASFQSDSLIRAVVQICHDLESRCDTIEGPLRVERERTTALEEELSRSRACVESLEQKRVDDSLYLGTLEAEKTQLEKDNDDLHARLENLRIELDKSNLQADTALREAREAEEAYNDTEMRLRSVILQHEETIEIEVKKQEALREKTAALDDALGKQEVEMHELANQYDDLQSRFEKEQDALEHQRQTNIRLEGRCTDLQNNLFEAERGLDEAKQSTLHKEEEIARIAREAAALKNDLQQTRVDLVTTSRRLEDLQVRHHELAQSSTKALQEIEAQCESDLEAAASKAAEEYHLLHEAYDGIQRDFERAQASIPPLQVQLQELEKECVMKDNELEDLKAWQKRVFTSMGLAPPAPGPAPTHATEGITNTAMDNLADASFLSSSEVFEEGSTPKRSKPRPSSKNLSTRTSYNNPSTIPKALSKRSKTQRSALRSISPNRRRTTVGVSVSERKYDEEGRQSLPLRKRRGSSQGGQESDFEMSFATNTPFTPGEFAAGTGTWPPESGSMTEL